MKNTKAMNADMITSLTSHVQMCPITSSSNDFYPAGSLNSFPEMPFRSDGCPSSPKPEDFGGAAAPPPALHPMDSMFPSIVYSNLNDFIYCNQTVNHDHVVNDNNLQSLNFWMSPAETRKRVSGGLDKPTVHRKSIDTFGQRTSQYRGVTRHRWTGRYEAHLWDNSCKKEGQTRKGRQVYLGGYDLEHKAARAYDLAAIKYWGPSSHINFAIESYVQELEEMKNMNRQEYVAHLRRKSSGFSRGASIYRGVTRHHHHGRWQARIGRVAGNKDLYLGTFGTQEEAAEAYDIAAVKFRGATAVTNFDISQYDVGKIMASTDLPAGSAVRTKKEIKRPSDSVVGSPSEWKMIRNNQSNGRDCLPEFGAWNGSC